jgi:DNA-binding SARP family transcriptional activator/predicted negative regulator of RcsB-dependent stress response
VQVRLLGPVDVVVDEHPRPVNGLRRKAVLATLALEGGEIVSTDRLVDVVWGDAASPKALPTLQSHVSFLRTVLGERDTIVARPPGYMLVLGEDGTDVRRAERLLAEASRAAEPAEALRLLREALALWRGRPLVDVAGLPWLEEQAERLDLLLVHIKRAMFEAGLAAGEHARLLPDIEAMVAQNPLDEQLRGQLMLALYRSGRQADALAAYHQLRQTLDTELGLDPGPELRELETAILRQDPALATSAAAAVTPPRAPSPAAPVPAQLPAAVPAFTGRDCELAGLDTVLAGMAQAGAGGPAPVVISAVSGTAGVGKTALAVHWAHRAAADFPDGQLYVNLRGFDPGGEAMDPGEAVRGFLDALGVPPERIPPGLPAQAGLYRSLLAGKRVLVVLDNARDAGQARPLLPGSPGCLALVTSRDQLSGLVAAEGARPLALDLLTGAEASDLLACRLGEARVAGEPEAAAEIIARCARLPLALTVAAARAATNPGFPLAAVAAELREATRALDPFGGGDLATDVRAVFSWSYRALTSGAARVFRLLGLRPGAGITVSAAASLAGVPRDQARGSLAELTRAHLLSEPSPGRYTCHDLLRAYATEQAHAQDTPAERDAAVARLLDHYLYTARQAASLIEPYFPPLTLDPPRPGAVVDGLATAEDALDWFTAEQATLLAAVPFAAGHGCSASAWQLAWSLSHYLLRCGLWEEQAAACKTGLDAARAAGDAAGQAHCLHRLANGYARSGRETEAQFLFRQALRQFEEAGEPASQGYVHSNLGWLALRAGRTADALGHLLQALDLYRAAGHAGQAMTLNDIGYCHALLGDYQQALSNCEEALPAVQQLAAPSWEAAIWDSLGYIHHHLRNHPQAVACYQRSIDLYREVADRYNEADTLSSLGDVHDSAGDTAAARQAWSAALRILSDIDHPDGAQVRAKLLSSAAASRA